MVYIGECSKVRESIIPTGDASPSGPCNYEPPMSQLRDILTSASDIEHSSNDHLDVKDLSFRTGSSSQTVTTSNPAPSIEINGINGERRASFKQNDGIESDLRTMRMRKFSETSTTAADHEHNHNSYKFKNYIKQRFSQDNHLEDKVGSSSGSNASSTEKSENLSKKRRNDTSVSGDDHDDDKLLHNGHSSESKTDMSTSLSTSSISNGRHPITSFCVPIFACHTQGYYIPLNVEYTALMPYLGEIDILNKNCNQLPPLHPVNININYSPAYSMTAPRCQFRRPKVENGW